MGATRHSSIHLRSSQPSTCWLSMPMADGDLDVALANDRSTANELWLNLGGRQGGVEGHFRFETFAFNSDGSARSTTFLVALDSDNDGDLDVAVANNGASNELHINDGTGHFRPWNSANAAHFGGAFELSSSLHVFDAEGDGDDDLVVTNWRGNNRIFLNDGDCELTLLEDIRKSRVKCAKRYAWSVSISIPTVIATSASPTARVTTESTLTTAVESSLPYKRRPSTRVPARPSLPSMRIAMAPQISTLGNSMDTTAF